MDSYGQFFNTSAMGYARISQIILQIGKLSKGFLSEREIFLGNASSEWMWYGIGKFPSHSTILLPRRVKKVCFIISPPFISTQKLDVRAICNIFPKVSQNIHKTHTKAWYFCKRSEKR